MLLARVLNMFFCFLLILGCSRQIFYNLYALNYLSSSSMHRNCILIFVPGGGRGEGQTAERYINDILLGHVLPYIMFIGEINKILNLLIVYIHLKGNDVPQFIAHCIEIVKNSLEQP